MKYWMNGDDDVVDMDEQTKLDTEKTTIDEDDADEEDSEISDSDPEPESELTD